MATQVMGARRRLRIGAALVALALASSVLVLAIQANSIWSSAPAPPAHMERILPDLGTSPLLPAAAERAINRAKFHGGVVSALGTTAIFSAAGERAINRARFHRDRVRAIQSRDHGGPR